MSEKSERIFLRISSDEKSEMQKIADNHNMSLSKYILSSARQNRIAEPAELKKIRVQLLRIGNLTNQIAHYANTYKSKSENALILDKLERVQLELEINKKIFGEIYDK